MAPSVDQYIRRVANIAIGSTTLRNQGASGVNQAARDFLASLPLTALVRDTEDEFSAELDCQTLLLRDSLPQGAQHWGTARKGLNVFLGEVYYHKNLSQHYSMEKVAKFLEVPLDKDVALFLRNKAALAGKALPRWRAIKSLTPEDSQRYQQFAGDYANTCGDGWIRLHVDLVAWRSQRSNI